MQKPRLTVFILVIILSVLIGQQASGTDSKTTNAIKAAEEFLILVDTSQYAQSWDTAATFFKSQVTKETWVKQISSLRPAFGKVTNRNILGAQSLKQLPGAPDGDYVVIQYNTSFENKRKAVETITPMLDKDGKWHVSGYYIQ
jgi:hypothetical protein